VYADELKSIRLSLNLDMRSMAICLGNMPYRTYQDYEYGSRSIPAKVVTQVEALKLRNQNFFKQIGQRIAEEYPNGIISA